MTELDEVTARDSFINLLDRVVDGKERVTVTRQGRPVAVLVPVEDWEQCGAGERGQPDADALRRLDALIEEVRTSKQKPPEVHPSPEWQQRFDEVVARIQSHIPLDLSPDEIEAEVRAAREEVRQERRARRR